MGEITTLNPNTLASLIIIIVCREQGDMEMGAVSTHKHFMARSQCQPGSEAVKDPGRGDSMVRISQHFSQAFGTRERSQHGRA